MQRFDRRPWVTGLWVICLSLASCSNERTTTVSETSEPQADEAMAASSSSTTSTDAAPPVTTPPVTTQPAESSTTATGPECIRLTDFASEVENSRWFVVNDDVMGGQSLGGLAFENDTLVFDGAINTDGGGFSSLRLPLEPDSLTPFDRIVFRARTDGRAYTVTFDDSLSGRDRRVSHRAEIPFEPTSGWQEASVAFDELFPAVFGRPIEDLPFRPDLATRMGLMISDGIDGEFRLEVDWIDLCEGVE